MRTKCGITKKRCSVAAIAFSLSFNLALAPANAACPSDAPTVATPVTIDSETSVTSGSRQIVNGSGTVVNTGTPGKVSIDLTSATTPAPLVITTYSSGGQYAPSANTFSSVTNATQINLPNTLSVPVGTVIALSINGLQGPTAVVTNGGAADENIIFNGSTTNHSITIKSGDVIYLANLGAGNWIVTSYSPFAPLASNALTNSHLYVGNSSNVATDVALSGDANISNTGAIAVTKTNGVSFAPSATTDTTNASNISSGILASSVGGTGIGSAPAKGSLLVGNSSGTAYASIPVGTDGQLLQADSASANGVKWSTGAGGVTSFSSGNLSPLFSTSVSNPNSSPALSFALSNAPAFSIFGNTAGTSAAPAFQTMISEQLPQRSVVMGGNGGSTGVRPLPNSGSGVVLTGEYWHVGDYNTNVLTGTVTCNRCRIHVAGNLTVSNAITVNTELRGGAGFPAASTLGGSAPGQRGQGLGGGDGGYQYTGGTTAVANAGGGGGNGGNGGRGGAYNTAAVVGLGGAGGNSYEYEHQLVGSGGGGGGSSGVAAAAGNGGNGGGALYLEISGNVTVDANITATGSAAGDTATSLVAPGGGGSGGTLAIISGGNITINASRVIDLSGGRGGNASTGANTPGGGGGGGGRFFARAAGTYTNSGTVTVSGGAAGTGGGFTQPATAGQIGIVDASQGTGYLIRTAP